MKEPLKNWKYTVQCGNPVRAIPEGHQNPKSPVTPPSHSPQENSLLYYKSSKYLWGTIPSSHFPRKCEDKSKTNKNTRSSQDKAGCLKDCDRKVSGLQSGDASRYAATLPESIPSPTQCFFPDGNERGNKFPGWMNRRNTHIRVLKTLRQLLSLKESDRQLLEMCL